MSTGTAAHETGKSAGGRRQWRSCCPGVGVPTRAAGRALGAVSTPPVAASALARVTRGVFLPVVFDRVRADETYQQRKATWQDDG